jgi:queuine tRNA-ribosyltransferase
MTTDSDEPARSHLIGHEVVTTRDGGRAIRDLHTREVMHPIVGARAESERLYAEQSRLRERLQIAPQDLLHPNDWRTNHLVLFDVGLGAASNALAARRISESLGASARPLTIVSFENDLGSLKLALQPEHRADFDLEGEPALAAQGLLNNGEHQTPRTRWVLRAGDLLAQLEAEPLRAEVIFWDPFSPRANPALWSAASFTLLHSRCARGVTLFTYAAATSVRAALLLGGFAVGIGGATGTTQETTAAAWDAKDLARPLDTRWLQRLERSSHPFPADAPPDALEKIRAAPQFR